ncbi:MAG: serine/threonine protein kinase [Breznakibacter sp.]
MILVKGDTANFLLNEATAKKGRFGTIWHGHRESDQLPVAVKSLTLVHPQAIAILSLLKTIQHHCIAPVLDFFFHNNQFFVVRPYFAGTDLKTILKTPSIHRKIDEMAYITMAKKLLPALELIHKHNIVHRDIKPSNILVLHPEGQPAKDWDFLNVMLIDFEQSTFFPDNSGVRAPFSLIYSPPEILLKYNYLINPSSDLFALAITLFHLIANKPPYTDCNAEILINLQLTYPLKPTNRMDDQLFSCLSKAAYKEPFPLPPRRMNPATIENVLKSGIEKRYQTASEMLVEINKISSIFKDLPPWYKRVF